VTHENVSFLIHYFIAYLFKKGKSGKTVSSYLSHAQAMREERGWERFRYSALISRAVRGVRKLTPSSQREQLRVGSD
jgi:hypothetical protein